MVGVVDQRRKDLREKVQEIFWVRGLAALQLFDMDCRVNGEVVAEEHLIDVVEAVSLHTKRAYEEALGLLETLKAQEARSESTATAEPVEKDE